MDMLLATGDGESPQPTRCEDAVIATILSFILLSKTPSIPSHQDVCVSLCVFPCAPSSSIPIGIALVKATKTITDPPTLILKCKFKGYVKHQRIS